MLKGFLTTCKGTVLSTVYCTAVLMGANFMARARVLLNGFSLFVCFITVRACTYVHTFYSSNTCFHQLSGHLHHFLCPVTFDFFIFLFLCAFAMETVITLKKNVEEVSKLALALKTAMLKASSEIKLLKEQVQNLQVFKNHAEPFFTKFTLITVETSIDEVKYLMFIFFYVVQYLPLI